MSTLNLLAQDGDEIVQSHWRQGRLPHFSGIIIGDGRLVVMNEAIYMTQGRMHNHVHAVCESSLSSFLELSGEFVEVTRSTPLLRLNGQLCAVGGEGEMGNEGFVAVVHAQALVWAAFFTTSNPFCRLALGNADELIATSTHELNWHFPVSTPWKVTVSSPNDPDRAR